MTIYSECANGTREYWTYSDGHRIYVSEHYVSRELARKRARIVEVN